MILRLGFLLFISLAPAWGMSLCELNYLSGEKHLQLFEENNKLWFLKIKELELKPDVIQRLDELPQEVEGKVSAGIFRAVSKNEDLVLKMIPGDMTLDQYAHKALLQKHLGDLGLAPKVKGLFAMDELSNLKANFAEINHTASLGILMEKIDGKMIKKVFVDSGVKTDLSGLPMNKAFKSKVRDRLKMMEKALNDLEVKAEDVQFMITKKGEVYLIDFDFYKWSPDPIQRSMDFTPSSFDSVIELFR